MSRLSVRFVALLALAAAVRRRSVRRARRRRPQAASPPPPPVPAPQGARVLTLDDALALADARNETGPDRPGRRPPRPRRRGPGRTASACRS